MAGESSSIGNDRSGGTSQRSGNPPAISFHRAFRRAFDNFFLAHQLLSQGFKDANTAEADYVFYHSSYEHLRPYLHLIKANPKNSTPRIQDAHFLMLFDRDLKSVIFKYIGVFETKMRAQYSGAMSKKYNDFCIYDKALFLRENNHAKSLKNYVNETSRKASKYKRISKIISKCNGKCPIEIGVECITLGTLSELYSNTKNNEVTSNIANAFGTSKAVLSNWLKAICAARNAIAHFEPFIVREQFSSTPIRIKGINGNNKSPFYISYILASLLAADIHFKDFNLKYAASMVKEIEEVLNEWKSYFEYLYEILGIETNYKETFEKIIGN